MKPEQENEMLRTIRSLKQEIAEIKALIAPIAPNRDKRLDTREACEMLKCSRAKLYRLIGEGLISCQKDGGRIFFKEYNIVAYLNR